MSLLTALLFFIFLVLLIAFIAFGWSRRLAEYDRAKRVIAELNARSSYFGFYLGQVGADGKRIDRQRSIWRYWGSLIVKETSLVFQQEGQQIFELAVADIARITYTPTRISFETKEGQVYSIACIFSSGSMSKSTYLASDRASRHDNASLSAFIEDMKRFNIGCQDTGWERKDVRYMWSGSTSPLFNVIRNGALVISIGLIVYSILVVR